MARCSSYDAGECTWGACELAAWVPEHWGNADQWVGRAAAAGYVVTPVPTLGAIASFAPGGAISPFGHVGVVVRLDDDRHYDIDEMNWAGFNRYDVRRVLVDSGQRFILPPGVAPGTGSDQPGPAVAGGVPGFELAWSTWQWFWDSEIETRVANLQGVTAALLALQNR